MSAGLRNRTFMDLIGELAAYGGLLILPWVLVHFAVISRSGAAYTTDLLFILGFGMSAARKQKRSGARGGMPFLFLSELGSGLITMVVFLAISMPLMIGLLSLDERVGFSSWILVTLLLALFSAAAFSTFGLRSLLFPRRLSGHVLPRDPQEH